ncbi:MAG: hypothetical protein SFW35_09215 [Chitinophagales bacterium]|nr:hypothetical protein [Chitinophagales bacterium]
MKNYFILWEQISLSEVPDIDNVHFFAIEHEGNIKYIGLAYKLSLEQELQETIKLFRLDSKEIKIWTGLIIRNIHNMVNQHIAEEILCLLVFNLKPYLNVICKRSYYGRDGLEIFNRGTGLFPSYLKADVKVMRMTGT